MWATSFMLKIARSKQESIPFSSPNMVTLYLDSRKIPTYILYARSH
jgi:hypothetical protein